METTILNPQYVYVQATTPSDLTEGKLWYNTTTNKTYVSDGSTYSLVADVDLSSLEKQQLRQSIAILYLEADASLTTQDYEDMFLDKFSDADGYDNTIDTGNTTSEFDIDHYKNGNAVVLQDVIDITGANSYNSNNITMNLTTSTSGFISKLSFRSDTDVTITIDQNGQVAQKTSSGGGNPNTINFTEDDYSSLLTANSFTITATSSGNMFRNSQVIAGNYVTGNNQDILSSSGGTTEYIFNTEIESGKIVTNTISVATSQLSHQVYCHNSVAGSGTITYNISFDNGSTWDTDQALNTKNTRTNATAGTQMILKLNLNGVGAGNTSEASDYAIMLWY